MGITKQNQIEEAYRNDKAKERLSESIARDDDVGFKETDFINLELIEAVENIQQKINKGEE
jgi:hypothetical protein